MGGGSYSYMRDVQTKRSYAHQSREQVFRQQMMSAEMNIHGKVRECRDSEEHPQTLPIIIALDVTGSMGRIPHALITGGFPTIMKKIMDAGIEHPQVCFVAIGDQFSDSAPIQVGQFEASDELLDHWLKTIWLESGGGGNGGESYQLAWWFAASHTDCDAINKRGQKGVLITIGDEAVHKSISKAEMRDICGDSIETFQMATSDILDAARQKWDVYHINLSDYMGAQPKTQQPWRELLGDHFINTEGDSGNDIPEIIAGIVVSAAKGATKASVATEVTQPVTEVSGTSQTNSTQHLR